MTQVWLRSHKIHGIASEVKQHVRPFSFVKVDDRSNNKVWWGKLKIRPLFRSILTKYFAEIIDFQQDKYLYNLGLSDLISV